MMIRLSNFFKLSLHNNFPKYTYIKVGIDEHYNVYCYLAIVEAI